MKPTVIRLLGEVAPPMPSTEEGTIWGATAATNAAVLVLRMKLRRENMEAAFTGNQDRFRYAACLANCCERKRSSQGSEINSASGWKFRAELYWQHFRASANHIAVPHVASIKGVWSSGRRPRLQRRRNPTTRSDYDLRVNRNPDRPAASRHLGRVRAVHAQSSSR